VVISTSLKSTIIITPVSATQLKFTVSAPTTGWVGFGFPSQAGKMLGSDVVIGYVSATGPFIGDYRIGTVRSATTCPTAGATSSDGYGVCLDTLYTGGSSNIQDASVTEQDGVTTIVFTRERVTGDPFDNAIGAEGTTQNFVHAFGSSDTLSWHSTNSYPGTFVVPTFGVVDQDCVFQETVQPCACNAGQGTQLISRTIVSPASGSGVPCPETSEIRSCDCSIQVGCPWDSQSLELWSQLYAGQTDVVIPATKKVLLDVSPGRVLNKIDVYGELVFSNAADLNVDAYFIYVRDGGQLWIGSADCPITSKVTITLFGTPQASDPPLEQASKVLGGFDGSKIDIHGVVRQPTWTVLSKHANSGDSQITLDVPVSWIPGDRIVIASTDYSHYEEDHQNKPYELAWDMQDEVRVVVSVTITADQKSIVQLNTPLNFTHYGQIWKTPDNTREIDMRAEVGLLTRNIVVKGNLDSDSVNERFGGHIMASGPRAEMRIKGVELYSMGQKDIMARYPIHFHNCQDQPNSYVVENSIHDTFQRCVTVHMTNGLLVKDNVAYNSAGHCYFIEDGSEHDNKFYHNLGIRANPHTLLKADATPAIFWITNPSNYWQGNVAVGGFFGFWFALPQQPRGLAASVTPADDYALMLPRHAPMLLFKSNKAHSTVRNGLHVDDGLKTDDGETEMTDYAPFNWVNEIPRDKAIELSEDKSGYRGNQLLQAVYNTKPLFGLVEDFTAYKCVEFGIWYRGERSHIVNAKLADNRQGAQFPGQYHVFEESFIVGETDNVGSPRMVEYEQGRSRPHRWGPELRIVGYRHYDAGGPNVIRNTIFYNFQDFTFLFNNKIRKAGAISVQGGHNALPPRHKYYNIKFVNSPNHFYYENPDYVDPYEAALYGATTIDVDGSLTGSCGSEVVYPNAILSPSCVSYPLWNAYVCPPSDTPRRNFDIQDNSYTYFQGSDAFARSTGLLYRLPNTNNPLKMTAKIYDPSLNSATRDHYNSNVPSNTAYLFVFGSQSETPSSVTLNFQHAAEGEWIRIAIPYPSGTTWSFTSEKKPTQVNSLSLVDNNHYYYDEGSHLLWLQLGVTTTRYLNQSGALWLESGWQNRLEFTASCPGGVCTQPIDSASVTLDTSLLPPAITQPICESNGNFIGGAVSYVEDTTVPRSVVFDDQFRGSWVICPWCTTTSIDSAFGATGSSIKVSASTNDRSAFFYRNTNVNLKVNQYTHLVFKIRSQAGKGSMEASVRAIDPSWNEVGDEVIANSPFNSPNGFIDDQKWYTVYVPLDALGINTAANVGYFRIYNTNWDWPLDFNFWIDDVYFAKFTRVVTPFPLDTSRADLTYNYFNVPPPSTRPSVCPQICPAGSAVNALADSGTLYGGCSVDGKTYSVDTHIPSQDSCKSCWCNSQSQVVCTQLENCQTGIPVWGVAVLGCILAICVVGMVGLGVYYKKYNKIEHY